MSSATSMAIMARAISTKIMEEGGVVRNITNLGDRILPKPIRSNDKTKTSIGRYIAFQVDANPGLKQRTMEEMMNFGEALRCFATKMKERSYITEVQRRLLQQTSPFAQNLHKNNEAIQDLYNYVEDYKTMREQFKDPKDTFMKHTKKYKGDFWNKEERKENWQAFSSSGTP